MKIAIVTRRYHRQGGISKGSAETAERLVELGNEVHIFANEWKDVRNKKINFHYVPMIKIPLLDRLNLFAWKKVFEVWSFSILSRLCLNYKDFDIVHVKGDSLAKFDVRSAHSCHRAWWDYSKGEGRGILFWIRKNINPLHAIVFLIERYNFRIGNYKKIIAVSHGVKREIMSHYGVPEHDIVVIPNGIDLDEFSPEKKPQYRKKIRQQYGFMEDDTVLIFVGHEFKRKGLGYIIETLNIIDNKKVKLLVVGGDNQKPYIEMAEGYGLKDRICFTGHQKDLFRLYAASDIFVFPTFYEAFSHAVLEAAASGLPLLVSEVNGAEELVDDGVNGFFIKREAISIVEKLKILSDDTELRIDMARKARETAKDYSWDRVTENILDIYRQVSTGVH